MKKILTIIISALMLAGPLASANSNGTASSAQQEDKKEKVTVTYKVSMHCENCVEKITENISFLKGVEDLKVSLNQIIVAVTYNPAKTDEATLKKAIEKLGYTAEKVKTAEPKN